jgi:hypothetical protein
MTWPCRGSVSRASLFRTALGGIDQQLRRPPEASSNAIWRQLRCATCRRSGWCRSHHRLPQPDRPDVPGQSDTCPSCNVTITNQRTQLNQRLMRQGIKLGRFRFRERYPTLAPNTRWSIAMPEMSAFDCLKHAENCERLANAARWLESRRALLDLAGRWRTLATASEAVEAEIRRSLGHQTGQTRATILFDIEL